MNKKMGLLGIIGALILIVAVSGCTSTPTNKTFTDGSMSFNYTSDFENSSSSTELISSSNNWQTIANLVNSDGVAITVQKSSLTNFTPADSIIATELAIKNANGTVVESTNSTNPNGVAISGSVNTLSSNGTIIRYYDMAFTANGQVYGISVSGKDSINTKILDVKNSIFNSIKVS